MKCSHKWVKNSRNSVFVKDIYPEIEYCPQCGQKCSGYLSPDIAFNPFSFWTTFNPFTGEKIKTEGCEGMSFADYDLEFEKNYTKESKMTLNELADYHHNSSLDDMSLGWFEFQLYKFKINYL